MKILKFIIWCVFAATFFSSSAFAGEELIASLQKQIVQMKNQLNTLADGEGKKQLIAEVSKIEDQLKVEQDKIEQDKKVEVEVPKDAEAYKPGDAISFPVDIHVKEYNPNTGVEVGDNICIPTTTSLRILSIEKDDENNNADGGMVVTARKGWLTRYIMQPSKISANLETARGSYCASNDDNPVSENKKAEVKKTTPPSIAGKTYLISKSQIDALAPSRYGLTYGGLTIPYKYYVNGSESFGGGATLAPYIGYRNSRYGDAYGLKLIAFAGIAELKTQEIKQVGTEEKIESKNLMGFSYGVGAIGEVGKSIQVGLVVGKDRASKGDNFSDNNKTWISIAIAVPFAN